MPRELRCRAEKWPLEEVFTISRGSKTEAEVVVVEIESDGLVGRGECVPYPHYNESITGVIDAIEQMRNTVQGDLGPAELNALMPAGAARNAIDCALWDLSAKQSGRPVHELAGVAAPRPVITAYTLSLADPTEMGAAAKTHASRALLKLKLGRDQVVECVEAVRENAPQARLIIDANEAWTLEDLALWLPVLARLGVEMVEQPLPAGADGGLAQFQSPVALGADESFHTRADLAGIAAKYQVVNVKLDKTGGLTEAIGAVQAARDLGLDVMIGCMVGTSLAMAPATLLAGQARFVDLDGPLLLAKDREPGLTYSDSLVTPPVSALWG